MQYLLILFYISIAICSLILLTKLFTGKLLIAVNSDLKSHSFTIEKSGFYSVWVAGKILRAVAIDKRYVCIKDVRLMEKKAIKSFVSMKVSGFKKGRFLLKYYRLKPGQYHLEVAEGEELIEGSLQRALFRLVPPTSSQEFGYELRKTLPEFIFPFLVLGIALPVVRTIELIQAL